MSTLTTRGRARARRAGIAALVLALAGLGWLAWRGPRAVVAGVIDQVGMRRVESFADDIHASAREFGVDPLLIAAIMFKESRGRPDSVSSAGALGLMQLVPAAAGDAARKLGLPEPTKDELLSDGALNIRLGTQHLAWLLANRGDWTLEQVLVSYNAGRQKLFRWMRRAGSYDAWKEQELRQAARGEATTGALAYALEALAMRERFARRGVVRPLEDLAAE